MIAQTQTSGIVNIGGQAMGEPISSGYMPAKHLESASYRKAFGEENTWLGILNVLDKYNKVKMPFISMTELSKNVLLSEGDGSKFTFGVPFMKGCPFIIENICGENVTPGKYGQPFYIVLSENVFTYGDILTSDVRNGRELRVQTIQEKGEDAKIIPHLSGYRYMVALDALGDEEAFYPQAFLEVGTPYIKSYQDNGGEFANVMSSYSGAAGETGHERSAVQLYEYKVGPSEMAIHAWVSADATYKKFKVDGASHPAVAHLSGASTDILNYWSINNQGQKQGAFWVSSLIQKMMGELAKMKENKCTWAQGKSYVSNGREKIVIGLGWYQQVKQRGNYDTYSDFDQLFSLLMNAGERLFNIHNNVPLEERVMKVKAGPLAARELYKRFGQYFKTDNPFLVMADHPALIKSNLLTYSDKTGLLYRPTIFKSIFLPSQGMLIIEEDESLARIDDYLENPVSAAGGSISSGMVFIEDISSSDFTNAIPTGLKSVEGGNIRNTTMIKRRDYKDKIEFMVGSDCSEQLLGMIGAAGQGQNVSTWNKGVEVRMSTDGEIWVIDPSKCWIIEYDPYGTIRENNQQLSLAKF
jgi:hypothetical protein